MSLTVDKKHHAIYRSGSELIAVPLVGWLDEKAVVLPRTGGSYVEAATDPNFLGVVQLPQDLGKPMHTPEVLRASPALLRDNLQQEAKLVQFTRRLCERFDMVEVEGLHLQDYAP